MAKDPAFLFYPSDWISGTMGMTFEEKGAYLELLMVQFNQGHMTSHMVGRMVGQLWDTIQHKFIKDSNGLWYNIRLDEEIKKRKSYTESRRNNLEGNNQFKKYKRGHMDGHMENENINENTNTNINVIKGGAGGKTKSGWSSANDGKNMISPSGNKIPCDIFVLNNMAGDAEAAKIGLEIYEIYKKKRDAENIKGK